MPERPRLKTRTHSAPVVDRAAQQNGQAHDPVPAQSEPEGRDFAQPASLGAMADGQDEDEVAGAVGAVRQYQHFQNSEVLHLAQY